MDHDSRSFPSRDSRTETPTDSAEEARSGGAVPQSAPMVQNATDAQSSGIQADAAQNGDSESGESGFSVSLIEWVEMFAGCFGGRAADSHLSFPPFARSTGHVDGPDAEQRRHSVNRMSSAIRRSRATLSLHSPRRSATTSR